MIKDRMGKMKQLQQAMLEDNWKGTPEDYLKWWINKEAKKIDKRNEESLQVKWRYLYCKSLQLRKR